MSLRRCTLNTRGLQFTPLLTNFIEILVGFMVIVGSDARKICSNYRLDSLYYRKLQSGQNLSKTVNALEQKLDRISHNQGCLLRRMESLCFVPHTEANLNMLTVMVYRHSFEDGNAALPE